MREAINPAMFVVLAICGCSGTGVEPNDGSTEVPRRDGAAVESLRCENGTLTLALERTFTTPIEPVAVDVGRLGEGPRRDLIWIDAEGAVATSSVDEPDAKLRVPGTGTPVLAHAVDDIDQDGRHDLVLVQGTTVHAYRGAATTDRSVAFADVEDFALSSVPRRASIVDIDHDGRLDVAVDDAKGLRWLAGDAERRFAPPIALTNRTGTDVLQRATPGDFDGDGRADAIREGSDASRLQLLANVGGVTRRELIVDLGVDATAWTVADLDRDGRTEAVAASDDGRVVAVSCDASATCRSTTIGWTSTPATSLRAQDINDDGLPDVIAVLGTTTEVLGSSCACDAGWTGPHCQFCSEAGCESVGGQLAQAQIVLPVRIKRRVLDGTRSLIEAIDPAAAASDVAIARMQAFVLAVLDADLVAVATVDTIHVSPASSSMPEPFAEAELRVHDDDTGVLAGSETLRGSTLVLRGMVPHDHPLATDSEGAPPPPIGSPHVLSLSRAKEGHWDYAHPEAAWAIVDGGVRVGTLVVPLALVQRLIDGGTP